MEQHIEIATVLKELYQISGFRVSLHDTEFSEIAAYPRCLHPFCRLVQGKEGGKAQCLRCDSNAFLQAKKSGKPYFYECSFGLWEAVAPLYHFGVLSGFLVMGQVRLKEGAERSSLVQRLLQNGCERRESEEAVEQLITVERERAQSLMSIMTICAEYITLSGKLSPPSKGLSAQVRRYVNANFHKRITLDGLCRHFKCSKSTLMTTFKKDYYQTVVEYINQVRLEHAALLLEKSDAPINEIALTCGFCDQCYFSKLFTRAYAMTPSRYRSEMKNKNEST